MKIGNVTVYDSGLFSQTRCCLEGYNKENDINPETKKIGIRSHHWFTAFFLKILGKIEEFKTSNGKVIYLNKASYEKWKNWRQAERVKLEEALHSTLPVLSIDEAKQEIDSDENLSSEDSELDYSERSVLEVEKSGQQESPLHLDCILKDIAQHSHEVLHNVFGALLKNFDGEIFKGWEFDTTSRGFKITLNKVAKLWIRPKDETGAPLKRTPRGVVLMLGESVEGRLDRDEKNGTYKIKFFSGFKTYCEYTHKVLSGTADARIKSIWYFSTTKQISIYSHGKRRGFLSFSGKEKDVQPVDITVKNWTGGENPGDNHEEFLKRKPDLTLAEN